MKVGQVVLYLKDEVDIWWKENEVILSIVKEFIWESFIAALREKFYPTFMRKLKAQEFINLRMRSMTISKYYSKLVVLSKFALEVIATEELKARWFEQGLIKEIQLGLVDYEVIDLPISIPIGEMILKTCLWRLSCLKTCLWR